MKTSILVIISIFGLLLIAGLKISFSPFSVKLEDWWRFFAFLFLGLFMGFLSISERKRGREQVLQEFRDAGYELNENGIAVWSWYSLKKQNNQDEKDPQKTDTGSPETGSRLP